MDPAPPEGADGALTTDGFLLDGRLRYAQPKLGFRSGIEPVLLAASVPARAGEHVLEVGSGAGAALLCLAARVPDIHGVGVEQDAALAALANRNAAANGLTAVAFFGTTIESFAHGGHRFDHACANPPYHADRGSASPLAARRTAKIAGADLPSVWAGCIAECLRPGATITLILAAGAVPAWCMALQHAGCTPAALLPLWPRAGRPCKLSLLRAIKSGRGAFQILPGLILHEAQGYSEAAEHVLRHGSALSPLG